ncbi:phage gp6-like head-tail connector protein [Streptococcus sp. O1]|nr:phage gp6-like head-tail connector protein [Streptococcus sp. O1]MCQ9215021.1 phage gp6-like head-tail connector protein [Streptococcus sp. O1]
MRIFHDSEDENLVFILEGSQATIKRLVGSRSTAYPEIKKLILENARYMYNDQAEFFYDNYQKDIQGLALELYEPEEDEDDDS